MSRRRKESDPDAPFQPYDFVLLKPGQSAKMGDWREPAIVLWCRRGTMTWSGWTLAVHNPRFMHPTISCASRFTLAWRPKAKAPGPGRPSATV